MNIRPKRPRQSSESIVPMINVVFLLLIFFLMTAQIAPPEPFEVVLPSAESGEDPYADVTLYVSREGQPGFNGLTGAPAMELLIEVRDKHGPLEIRAHEALEAQKLASLLRELTAAGFARVEVMVGG